MGNPPDAAARRREVIEFGREVEVKFAALLANAKYSRKERQAYAACLCLTIAEGYAGVITLLGTAAESHAPALGRVMVEALADLANLVADPAYIDQMRFDNADQQLKTFAGFRDDPDVGLSEDEQKELRRWIAIERDIYDKLYSKERKAFGTWDKFERAGMLDLYATTYRFFCSFSHSDLNTLIARHAGEGVLNFAQLLPPETLLSVVGTAASLYAAAIGTAPNYSSIAEEEAIAASTWLHERLETLQAK